MPLLAAGHAGTRARRILVARPAIACRIIESRRTGIQEQKRYLRGEPPIATCQ